MRSPRFAVLLCGQMRTFNFCFASIKWQVLRHLGNCDFFVSTTLDEQTGSVKLLEQAFPDRRIQTDIVKEQPDVYADLVNQGVIPDKDYRPGYFHTHEPHVNSVHPRGWFRQYWQLSRAYKIFRQTTKPGDYDFVVRLRPDLHFQSFEMPDLQAPHAANTVYTPWWGRWGGVNDRFALMGDKAAHAYFECLDIIPELRRLGAPVHPECLMKASLEYHKVVLIPELCSEFATIRLNGEVRQPEISNIDLAHLTLRRPRHASPQASSSLFAALTTKSPATSR